MIRILAECSAYTKLEYVREVAGVVVGILTVCETVVTRD